VICCQPRAGETGIITDAIKRCSDDFTVVDILRQCSDIGIDMDRRVLKDLQALRAVLCIGRVGNDRRKGYELGNSNLNEDYIFGNR